LDTIKPSIHLWSSIVKLPPLAIHPQVRSALDGQQPVVALESTLISHGLPRPRNLEVARALEATVHASGAIPATIAILRGQITVGLSEHQLSYLAGAENIRKCSRRDLPIAVAHGEDAATTVAATMLIAHMAGIRVFATGGIGGVHRGQPFDVSADLLELSRTPVVVVCAGAKAILDLPLTLEVLETQGVPVVGYGTDEFPAFYTRSSGLPVDFRCDTPQEVAKIACAHGALNLAGGMLVTVPVPQNDELQSADVEAAVTHAQAEAEAEGITGSAVTPFLLARVNRLTDGASLRANVALLLNNARVASAIAAALSVLMAQAEKQLSSTASHR
jgi:pseudouridine-5'-phosphate glycosidase